ncbi:uncharacterized protein DUF350 [Archangium gephyra]|uniref:Uncharacterized protein DUF350 n=1 Tax=Archangium gephyra TaxID=48 RepID=A0AAC8Q717_9BACT|nr:DUF350 domain-containing protein [Archangium gephyra]AKJ02122.1 Hypothetical protein AA314_03748 [Archangium gephyra]REG28948.1 uncharacterized protein DUF350 [Archangium gephyra]
MELRPLYLPAFGAITTVVLLLLLRAGQRLLSPAHTVRADMEEGHMAHALVQVGQVLGLFLISGSVVAGCVQGESLSHDVLWVSAYGLAALVLLVVFGHLGVRVLLRARLAAEVERGNIAAGLAAGSHYLATGILLSRSVSGTDLGTLGVVLVFVVIAQVTLHLFVMLFRTLTAYDDAEEILGENLAAALSYAGITVALSLIIGHAVEGTFEGWAASLRGYALALVFALALYPVRQLFVQTLLLGARFTLRGGRLDQGIAAERNLGMGVLEAVSYLAAAFLVTRLA